MGKQDIGKLFNANNIKFTAGANRVADLPCSVLPEIVLLGRSNVGKSSLINALFGRKKLAFISKDPGRTRKINIFSLKEVLNLADVPGYGYAKVSQKMTCDWSYMMCDYLRGNRNIVRAFILIDARRLITDKDYAMIAMLEQFNISYRLVYTKSDKLKATEMIKLQEFIKNNDVPGGLCVAQGPIVSALKGNGMDELRMAIVDMIT